MKKFQNKNFIVFVIIGLLSLFGQQAFAFSSDHFVQEYRGDSIYNVSSPRTECSIFQQISFGKISEYSEHSSKFSFGKDTTNCTFHLIGLIKGINIPTNYFQDHRDNLKHKIFPFHFFW